MPERKKDTDDNEFINKYRGAIEEVMKEHDMSSYEIQLLFASTSTDPKKKTLAGKLAGQILDSVFKQIEEKIKKI